MLSGRSEECAGRIFSNPLSGCGTQDACRFLLHDLTAEEEEEEGQRREWSAGMTHMCFTVPEISRQCRSSGAQFTHTRDRSAVAPVHLCV